MCCCIMKTDKPLVKINNVIVNQADDVSNSPSAVIIHWAHSKMQKWSMAHLWKIYWISDGIFWTKFILNCCNMWQYILYMGIFFTRHVAPSLPNNDIILDIRVIFMIIRASVVPSKMILRRIFTMSEDIVNCPRPNKWPIVYLHDNRENNL